MCFVTIIEAIVGQPRRLRCQALMCPVASFHPFDARLACSRVLSRVLAWFARASRSADNRPHAHSRLDLGSGNE
jgi:hypothetical protein